MSHFTKIKTKIIDLECLKESLLELNYNIKENSLIQGYRGRTRKGDLVISTGKGYDVGFIKSEGKSYDIVADWYGATKAIGTDQVTFLNNVVKEYSTQKILKEIKQKGYRLRSRRVTETGEIKLVVVKRTWSQ